MPRFADHLTGIADILHSTAENGEVRVNYGEETSGEGFLADVQTWGPDGFISRPNDPSDKGCAQVLYLVDGQQQRAIAFRDNRFAKQAGSLEPGDRMLVTDGPSRIYLKRKRAQVGFYTEAKNAFPDGSKGMVLDMDGESGVVQIKCGGCIISLDGASGKITLTASGPAGASSIVLDPIKGIQLLAGIVNLDAPFSTLGLNSDGSRPGKPGVDTVLIGPVGQAGIPSVKCYAPAY